MRVRPKPGKTRIPESSTLEITQPGDAFEADADRLAERVMRTAPDNAAATGIAAGPAATHSGAQPLDPQTRAFMEPRFGFDFSQVRIHTGDDAAASAQSVDARAYTVGEDVVFGRDQYNPAVADGRRLIAHELAHVVQQRSGLQVIARDRPQLPPVSGADTPQTLAERAPGVLRSVITRTLGLWGAPNLTADAGFAADLGDRAVRALGADVTADQKAEIMRRAETVAALTATAGGKSFGIPAALRAIGSLHATAQGNDSLPGVQTSYGLEYLRMVTAGDIADHFAEAVGASSGLWWGTITLGNVQHDLDMAVEASANAERLLNLELEGTVQEVIRLRGLWTSAADQDERAVLGQAIGEASRRAMLLNQALLPLQGGIADATGSPLDQKVLAMGTQIAGIRRSAQTETATRSALTGGGRSDLELLTVQDITLQNPTFPEQFPDTRGPSRAATLPQIVSGNLPQKASGAGVDILPEQALPQTVDAAATRMMNTLEERVRTQQSEVKKLRGQVVPDKPTYTIGEFADVFARWFGFFSLGQEAQDPTFADLAEILGFAYNMFGSDVLTISDPLFGKIAAVEGGFARAWLMNFVASKLEGYMGGATSAFTGQLRGMKPTRRQDELTGSASSPDLWFGELYPDPAGRTYAPTAAGETTSRRAVAQRRQAETAKQFTEVAKAQEAASKKAEEAAKLKVPAPPGSDPTLAGVTESVKTGLVPATAKQVPLIGMHNVEAREGWSYLIEVWKPDPLNPTLVAREQQVMRPEVVDYLLARRQQVGALEQSHIPTVGGKAAGEVGMMMGGVEAGGATSAATYLRGEDMPEAAPAAKTMRATIESARDEAGVRGGKTGGRGSKAHDPETRIARELILDLRRYLEGFFREKTSAEYRLGAVFVIANIQFRLGKDVMKLVEPARLAEVMAEAAKITLITSGLESLGPLGKIASKGYQAHLAFQGVSNIAAIIGISGFFINASREVSNLEKARIWALMSRHVMGDITQLFDAVGGHIASSVVHKAMRRLTEARPATPGELAAMCRPMMSDPAARKALLEGTDARIAELEKAGAKPDTKDPEYQALVAFREELGRGKAHDPAAAKAELPGMHDDTAALKHYEANRPRSVEQWRELLAALPEDLKGRVPIVANPNLEGTTVRVMYGQGHMRMEIGPGAKEFHIKAHVETARKLMRYEGVTGHVRRLLDRAQALLGLGGPEYGTLGHEAKLEVEKLTSMVESLKGMERAIYERSERLSKDPELAKNMAEADAIRKEIDGLQKQLAEHEANLQSYEKGRGYVAATGTRVSRPPRVLDPANYHEVDETTGANKDKKRLTDRVTGEQFLFKPKEGEVELIGQTEGILAGERYRRVPAAAMLAREAGVQTPTAEIVYYKGKIGSLQQWVPAGNTLAALERRNPAAADLVKASQAKKDLDTFDYLIANMDRNTGNLKVVPEPGTTRMRIVPIDMDISFPNRPDRYSTGQPMPGYQEPLPNTISTAMHNNLLRMNADRARLREELRDYLDFAEIEGTFTRLDHILDQVSTGHITVVP
jgi:hypothetical protein